MKARRSGKRHVLLLYRRAMDRIWQGTLPLGLIMGIFWWQIKTSTIPIIELNHPAWLLVGAVFALPITLFAILARYMAYIQAHANHLRLVIPFYRFNISYRRVFNIHPANFNDLFPPSQTGWARRRFLSPFYGRTVVVIVLKSYPISPQLLRLFFPHQMFSPQESGLVLLVPDWMALSTELDSVIESWRQSRNRRRRSSHFN